MLPINRRHFLQFAGSALASIALSDLDFFHQGEHYGKVLAQGTPGRKLALLVGVNAYPGDIPDLRGCLTDVELQWKLLVHRFGFSPKDILVVADKKLSFTDYEPQQPTQQNILQAFEQHLIRQAKPGDGVVFHFFGHGSLVNDRDALKALKEIGARGRGVSFSRSVAPEPFWGEDPVDVVGALLGNIGRNTRSDIEVSTDV